MKVFVNYAINRGESKLIKKFYRFNVVEPLVISSAVRFVKDKIVAQFEIINKCKHSLVLENVSMLYSYHDANQLVGTQLMLIL